MGSTIEKIMTFVAKFYNLNLEDMKRRTRKSEIAKPRQVAMYLLRDMVGLSFPSIGRTFGLDHTTVLYAFEKISDQISKDSVMKGQIDSIKAMVTKE